MEVFTDYLNEFFIMSLDDDPVVSTRVSSFKSWLIQPSRRGHEFSINICNGHNALCAMFLRNCGNKSIAVEHPYHNYLKTYGPNHLRQSSRGLRKLCSQIRKIDETAGIKGVLPYQLGYVSGLQELYARRVGICGQIPIVRICTHIFYILCY